MKKLARDGSPPGMAVIDAASDWFDLRQLPGLTGRSASDFDRVLLKELLDNGVDGAEEACRAPVMDVEVRGGFLAVRDNGGGMNLEALEAAVNLRSRASTKEYRRAVSRGQQGNAFKTLVGIPAARARAARPSLSACRAMLVGGAFGPFEITVDFSTGTPTVRVGNISRGNTTMVSLLTRTVTGTEMFPSTFGTAVVVPVEKTNGFTELIAGYALANPHLRLSYVKDGAPIALHEPIDDRWRPSSLTAAHWYTAAEFEHLCDVARQLGWTFAQLVREFHSVRRKADAREVLRLAGVQQARLCVRDAPRSSHARVFEALRKVATEPSVAVLQPVGARRICARMGEGARYKRVDGVFDRGDARIPFVVEAALVEDPAGDGEVITAINNAPTFTVPWEEDWFEADAGGRKTFDGTGLHAFLESFLIDPEAPCRMFLHLTCPSLRFRDRGKSTLDSPAELTEAVSAAVLAVARTFAGREERRRKSDDPCRAQRSGMNLVDASRLCLTEAIKHTAGRFNSAMARQVGYRVRDLIQKHTARTLGLPYFTQAVMPRLLDEDPELAGGIEVHYDARGHLYVPHEGRTIALGTRQVRSYLREPPIETGTPFNLPAFRAHAGAGLRYGAILFVEKEGFDQLLHDARIPERFDVLLTSSKGQSTTALRELLDRTHGRVVVLVLHDFDVSGFEIARVLGGDTRRFTFENPPTVIDLGLRLADVKALNLGSESVTLKSDFTGSLKRAGATAAELKFLTGTKGVDGGGKAVWHARRVELNAMTNDQIVALVESKLERYTRKVIPDRQTLAATFESAVLHEHITREVAALKMAPRKAARPPPNLVAQIRRHLARNPDCAWDDAIVSLARGYVDRASTGPEPAVTKKPGPEAQQE